MQYKTIVLELLKERTELHEQLRLTRRLLPTMETCARELKASHETWMETLAQANPGSDPEPDLFGGNGTGSQGTGGSFALRASPGRRGAAFARPGDGIRPQSFVEKVRASRNQPSLFDQPPRHPAAETRPPPPPPEPARDTQTASHEATPPNGVMASGEKSKARDIIAAIRTLKAIEQERRPATPEEKQILARFSGFGPVALSIFPDPVTGKYKDAGWQALGEELKTLLTPIEYDSAKRTTFNAFYTSPTVITTIHEAIARLGVPANATILEPGCGTGNFMSHGQPGARFIGVEMDSISGRIARALHPDQDIRIESFRDTKLPEDRIDAVVGNVPFADLKLDYRGQKLSLHDYFFAKSVDALKPGGVLALVTTHFTLDKQNAAIREQLAAEGRFRGSDPPALGCLQTRRHGRRHRHRVPAQAGAGRAGPPCRSRLAGRRPACHRGRGGSDQPLLPEPSRNGPWHLDPQGHALWRGRLQRHQQRRPGRAS